MFQLGLVTGGLIGLALASKYRDKILDELQDPNSVTRYTLSEAGYMISMTLDEAQEVLREAIAEGKRA